MEQKSQVFDVQVDYEGQVHRASYFVENDTIYANVGGRMLLSPLGQSAPADTVKALLSGYLHSRSRKLALAKSWSPGHR